MSEAPDVDDPFAEQPGDREPDPSAAAPEPEPEVEPEPEDGAEGGDEEPEPVTSEASDDGAGDEEEEPAPRKTDWRDKQIIKARQKAKEAEDARKAAEERAAALEELLAKPEGEREAGDKPLSREEALRVVREEQRLETLNKRLDGLFDEGQKAFPKSWDSRIREAGEALRDELQQRPDFFEAVADLDNATAVYHELAGDIDRFESVLALPPAKMGMELARISAKLTAPPKPKPVSKAPAPIKPLDKPTIEDLPLDDPNISQEEFNRRMDAMEEKRFAAQRR